MVLRAGCFTHHSKMTQNGDSRRIRHIPSHLQPYQVNLPHSLLPPPAPTSIQTIVQGDTPTTSTAQMWPISGQAELASTADQHSAMPRYSSGQYGPDTVSELNKNMAYPNPLSYHQSPRSSQDEDEELQEISICSDAMSPHQRQQYLPPTHTPCHLSPVARPKTLNMSFTAPPNAVHP